MSRLIRNILVLIAALVTGSVVNAALVNVGPYVIPLPPGADVSNMENLRDSMAMFSPANFLFPFLGHALGTLAGAFIAARFAVSHHLALALIVGVCFLFGGIAAVSMLGGPLWFIATDLILAYIPMSYLGARLAGAGVAGKAVANNGVADTEIAGASDREHHQRD